MISSLDMSVKADKTSRHFVALICRPRINLVLKITLVFIVFCLIALIRLDPDFGWHLQAGNYIRVTVSPATIFLRIRLELFVGSIMSGNDVIVSLLYGLVVTVYWLLSLEVFGRWPFMAGSGRGY